MSSTEKAATLLETHLADLTDEAGRLERAIEHLTPPVEDRRAATSNPRSRATSSRRKSSRPSKTANQKRRSPAGRKRAKRGQRQQELLTAIKRMRGASANELADAMQVGATQVHGLLRKAESGGQIAKRGQGYEIVKV